MRSRPSVVQPREVSATANGSRMRRANESSCEASSVLSIIVIGTPAFSAFDTVR